MPLKFKPKKNLGQVFLKSEKIKRKILESMNLTKEDIVFEIGAGRGELTSKLIEKVKFIYAVEIDPTLCKILEEKFKEVKNIKIINGDILKLNFEEIYKECTLPIILFGNLPFHISTPLLMKLIQERKFIKEGYFTLQKEVALKIKAKENTKTYGFLSCYFNVFCDVKMLFFIEKRNFSPIPEVDSAFLYFKFYEKPKFFLKDEKKYLKFLRLCFNQRRKKIKNVLNFIPKKTMEEILKKIDLDKNVRAEYIQLEKYPELFNLCFDFFKQDC